jgi:hypothetical protein
LNPGYFSSVTFILVSFENSRLSRGVQVADMTWWVATRIATGVGDPVQRTGDDPSGWVLDGQTIVRSGNTVYDLHCAQGDEEREFLG